MPSGQQAFGEPHTTNTGREAALGIESRADRRSRRLIYDVPWPPDF
jgi:hypothetical protein